MGQLDTLFLSGAPPSGCTQPSGATTFCIYDNMDYLPFGEQIAGSSAITHKFTSKERDAESGLDDFGARYNASSLGRFMSPDPDNAGAFLDAPQSWNAYSYVLNNPLNAIDPLGLFCVWDDGSFDANDDPGTGSFAQCQGPNGAGGTWFNGDPSTWGLGSDWSSQPNATAAEWAFELNPDGAGVSLSHPDSSVQVSAAPDFFATTSSQLPSAVCRLFAPFGHYTLGTGAVPLFQPQMADPLTAAFASLNAQGIVPKINDGFRTAADQQERLRNASRYPAAKVSLHQEGLAVDINIDRNFPAVKSALLAQNLTWGGLFLPKHDPVHFQLPPAGTKADPAMIAACGGN